MAGMDRVHRAVGLAGVAFLGMAGAARAPDLNGDFLIDCDDLAALSAAFGSQSGDANFHAAADLHPDGRIDGRDLALFMVDFPVGLDCLPILDPDRFVPVDARNEPVEGMLVRAAADGSLPPLVFRPAGASIQGRGQGLSILMPEGARLVEEQGEPRLEVGAATAFYGGDAPIRFAAPMVRSGGSPAQIPLADLTASDLARLFGFTGLGVPVEVFDTFPLRWTEGRLTDAGIVGAEFRPDIPNVPLPVNSSQFPAFRMDVYDAGEVRIPFDGAWVWPDGSASAPQVSVPASNPLWLVLRRDGSVRLSGRVDLAFPGGPTFRADLVVDDPYYRLQVMAEGLEVEAIGTLSDLLPPSASACIPAGTSDAELDQAAACLLAFARAYHLFSASTVGAAPYGVGAPAASSPPEPVNLAGAVLEAWAYSGLTGPAQALPLDALQGLVRQVGQACAAAGDLEAVTRYRLALLRAREAVEAAGMTGSPDAEAELAEALAEAEAAAVARSREPGALNSLASAREVMRMLLECETIRQEVGLPANGEFMGAMVDILDRFAFAHVSGFGVTAGQYDAAANPLVADMNRFRAHQHLHDLVGVLADAQLLGVDGQMLAPVPEALSQLALRLFAAADAALDEAEAQADYHAFRYALLDLLDLQALQQLGVFPSVPELAGLPDDTDLLAYAARLDALFVLEMARPYGERSLDRNAEEVERLLRVLREMPAGATFAPTAFERAFNRMEDALDQSVAQLFIEDDLPDLLQLLQAGILHDGLGVHFGFGMPVDWVTVRLPEVVDRLVLKGTEQNGWSELYQGARMLMAEAARLDLDGSDPVRRKACLEKTADVLAAARAVAVTLWADEEARRANVDPSLLAADMILPGDVLVDEVGGSVAYHRESRFLSGAFQGTARLPKFDASLTVKNASLNSGGVFDLSLYGSASLPPGAPALTFSIPQRRPFYLGFSPNAGLRLSGAARADFDNGLSLQSYWRLEDPVYEFGLAAEGLHLDLADELTLLMPDIDPGAGEVFAQAVREDLNTYYRSMSATLEGLLPLASLPEVDTRAIGRPPDFEPPAVTVELDGIEAWVNHSLSNVADRVNGSYTNSLDEINALLEVIIAESEAAAQGVMTERQSWEYQVMVLGALRLARVALERLEGTAATGSATEDGGSPGDTRALLEAALRAKRDKLQADIAANPAQTFDDALAQSRSLLLIYQESLALDLTGFEDVLVTAQQIQASGRQLEFTRLGLHPDTGAVENQELFNSFSLDELQQARIRITYSAADSMAVGDTDLSFIDANGVITQRRVEKMREKVDQAQTDEERIRWGLTIFHEAVEQQMYDVLPDQDLAEEGWTVYMEAITPSYNACRDSGIDYRHCGDFRRNWKVAKETNRHLNEKKNRIIEETVGELDRITPFDPPDPPPPEPPPPDAVPQPQPDERGLLELLIHELDRLGVEIDQAVADMLDELARLELDEISVSLNVPGGSVAGYGLAGAETLLRGLVDVGAWIQHSLPDDPALVQAWQVNLDDLTHEFTAVAEAEKAWWWMSRYTELLNQAAERYGEQVNQVLAQSLDEAASASLLASASIADDLAQLLAAVQAKEVVIGLPGDLEVRRAFGSLYYDRSLPFFEGTFGGHVVFPEIGTTFNIREASIASDGSFSIDAFTHTPLPFDGVEVDASINVVGDATGLDYVSGDGTVYLDSGEQFDVEVTYDEASHQLSFNSLAQNLDIRFTDDFVIFDAGFGLDVSTVHPAGKLTAVGSAGMFALDTPLPADVGPEDFHLYVDEITASFDYQPGGFAILLESGDLHLPSFMSPQLCQGGDPGGGPVVTLSPVTPLHVTYAGEPSPSVSFAGSLAFRNIGFAVPDFPDLAVEVCTATLDFNGHDLPTLTDLSGRVSIPLPDEPLDVSLSNITWSVDGFPEGTIAIHENLQLLEQAGFTFELLGANPDGCPEAGLTISNYTAGFPYVRIAGGIELTMPSDVLVDDSGGTLSARACGHVQLEPGLVPDFYVDYLAFTGQFRVGGPDGFLVDGSITVEQPGNLFDQSPEHPFILRMDGTLGIPAGPSFILEDAMLAFEGDPAPRFGGGLIVDATGLELVPGLPVTIEQAGFYLDPAHTFPEVLYPQNVQLILSGAVDIAGLIGGRLDDLRATLDPFGDFEVSADGVGMSIGSEEIPMALGPLLLVGEVYIAGLADPANWYFAGRLGGQIVGSDVGLMALLAFNSEGILGVCLDVNAGPGGIPLGQTTLLLTGAQGGLAFSDRVGDPCEFTASYPVGDDGKPIEGGGSEAAGQPWWMTPTPPPPMITWDELAMLQAVESKPTATGYFMATEAGEGEDCNLGDCPPGSVGLLCQPHPDTALHPDRIIFKLTALDESLLNLIGIEPAFFTGMNSPEEIGEAVALEIRGAITAIIPPPDPGLLPPEMFAELEPFYWDMVDEIEAGLSNAVAGAVVGLIGNDNTVYQAVVDAAWAGIPCPQITMKLQGTLSQAAVSTFLSADVGVVLGTDITLTFVDSVGAVGEVNLLGIPVGGGKLFINYFDASGAPNPSLCGYMDMSVGPLEMGQAGLRFECPECVTGILDAMADLFACVGSEVTDTIVSNVAPDLLGLPYEQLASTMTDDEKMTFLAEVFAVAEPPPGFYDDLAGCFFDAVSSSWDSVQPHLGVCGSIQPKIFGIGMGSELVGLSGQATKTNLTLQMGFSPSYMLLAAMSMNMFPPFGYDYADFGVGFGFPDAGEFLMGGLSGRFNTPEAFGEYLEGGFADFLADATYTVGYELSPFGLTLASGQARVVMPNLTDPPAFRDPAWERPSDRGYPSRLDLVLGALAEDILNDPYWKGTADDLFLAYPEGHPDRGVIEANGLSFAQDYFPHGGVIGAARLTLPPAIVDAPPDVFYTMLDPGKDILSERLPAAAEYIQGYALSSTSEVGSLVFYVPAPNPPGLTNDQGEVMSPIELMESIKAFDFDNINPVNPYPIEAAFFRGYLDGRLVGVPIASGEVEAFPADQLNDAYFRVAAGIPGGSWLSAFVDSASLEFEIRQPPPRPIDERFMELLVTVTNAIDDPVTFNPEMAMTEAYESLADDLPKVSMEVTVDNLHIPEPLDSMLVSASSTTEFFAYSPRFEPDYIGTGPVAVARQEGGLAFRGSYRFADLVDADAELSISPNPPALPRLMGAFDVPRLEFVPGWGFHDIGLDFDTEPGPGLPFLRGQGALDELDIGVLRIEAVGGGGQLHGLLEVIDDSPNPPDVHLEIDAAEISAPALFGPGLTVAIHGTDGPTEPFTFSTDGPWGGEVTLAGDLVLQDPVSGTTVLSMGMPADPSAVVTGDALDYLSFSLEMPVGSVVTAFPGQVYQKVFALGSPGSDPISLTVNSDGTFHLHAELEAGLAFSGEVIGQVGAGAEVDLTESSLHLLGSMSGSLLGDIGAGSLDASGELYLDTAGHVSISASVEIPQMVFGVFRVTSAAGPPTPIVATVDAGGIRVPNGAKLTLDNITDDGLLTLNAFSVAPDGSFGVDVSSGAFTIPDYFSLGSGSMTFSNDGAGVVFFELNTPTVTLFPGAPHQADLAQSWPTLSVSSTGEFSPTFDSGQLTFDLPGGFQATGQLEIGYEPDDTQPGFTHSPPSLDFSVVDQGQTETREVTVWNTGHAPLYVTVTNDNPQRFPVSPNSLTIQGQQLAVVHVGFSPNGPGTFNAGLHLHHNADEGPGYVALTGEGPLVPVWHQSASSIDFGEALVGGQLFRSLKMANLGTANLVVSSVTVSGDGFSISPAGGFTLTPGGERDCEVVFAPPDEGSASGQITFQTSLGTKTVTLSGSSTVQRWYVQREGQVQGFPSTRDDLWRVKMLDDQRGWTAGLDGLLMQTGSRGRGWTPRPMTGIDLYELYVSPEVNDPVLALHFEEGNDSLTVLDGSSFRRHGRAESTSTVPARDYAYGHIGKGLRFDGVNDVVDLVDFDLADNFTIALWVNPFDPGFAGQALVAKNDADGGNRFIFGIFSGEFYVHCGSSSARTGTVSPGWQHLAVAVQGSQVAVYRDGSLVWNLPVSPLGNASGGKPWCLGQEWDGTSRSNFFLGEMDQVVFFDRRLSTSDIQALAANRPRAMVCGAAGRAYQTRDLGATWQALDDTLVRWSDTQWTGAAENRYGEMMLAGWSAAGGYHPVLLVETADMAYVESSITIAGSSGLLMDVGHNPYDVNRSVAVGQNGLILLSDDHGHTWADLQARYGLASPVSSTLRAVAFATGPNVTIAVGNNGTIVRGSGSTSWTAVHQGDFGGANLYDVSYADGVFHAVGQNGTYVYSTDLGLTWSQEAAGTVGLIQGVNAFEADGATELIAVGADARLMHRPIQPPAGGIMTFSAGTLEFGQILVGKSKALPLTVYNQGADTLSVSAIQVEGSAFVLGQDGPFDLDPGAWLTLTVTYMPTSVSELDAGRIVFMSDDAQSPLGVDLRGRCDLASWEEIYVSSAPILAVQFPSSSVGYALTHNDLHKSTDGGQTWVQMGIVDPGIRLNAMDFLTTTTGLICGDDGYIFKTTDGSKFYQQNSGTTLDVMDIDLYDATHAVAVSARRAGVSEGEVLISNDGGANWGLGPQPAAATFDGSSCAMYYRPFPWATYVYYVSSANVFHFLTSTLRVPVTFHETEIIRDISLLTDNNGAWIGGENGLFWTLKSPEERGPPYDAQLFGSDTVSSIHFRNTYHGIAAAGGRIYRSTDSGETWDLMLSTGADVASVFLGAKTEAWAAGQRDGKGMVWRHTGSAAGDVGVLTVNNLTEWTGVPVGQSQVHPVVLRNAGTDPVVLDHVTIESESGQEAFRITGPVPDSIPAGGTATVDIEFAPRTYSALPDDTMVFLRFEEMEPYYGFGDLSGNGYHGSGEWVFARGAGQHGLCASFAAYTGSPYVDIADFDLGEEFTVALWANPYDPAAGGQALVAKNNADGGNRFIFGIYNQEFYVHCGSSSYRSVSVNPGWQHLAVTVVGSQVTVYKDGAEVWTQTLTPLGDASGGKPWCLGQEWDGGNRSDFFDGWMDEVGIYNRALGLNEIQELATPTRVIRSHTATLAVHSDAQVGFVETVLRGRAAPPDDLVTFDTEPSGLLVKDEASLYWPGPMGVRLGVDGGAGRTWALGSVHYVEVPAAQDVDGVSYVFAEWSQGGDRKQVMQALPGLPNNVARFVPLNYEAPAEAVENEQPATESVGGKPKGPFVRLSNASLSHDVMDFNVSGDMYLAANRFQGTLRTSGLAFPETNPLVRMAGKKWAVDYEKGDHFTIRSQLSGLEILGKPAGLVPRSEMVFDIDISDDNGHFDAVFRTKDDLVVIDSVVEFGPMNAILQYDGNLSLEGSLPVRLLKKPDGNWAFNYALASLPQGDFTLNLGSPTLNLGFLSLHPGGLLLHRTGGVMAIELQGYQVYLFGTHLGTVLSGTASTDRVLDLQASMTSSAISITGTVFQIQRVGTGDFAMTWDYSTLPLPDVRLTVPTVKVIASGVSELPGTGITLGGFTFDSSGDFDTGRIALPSFSFDGINCSQGGALVDNFIKLKRDHGVTSFHVRDKRTFFLGTMQMKVDVDSEGNIDAEFQGKVEFNFINKRVELLNATLDYETGREDYQFVGTAEGPLGAVYSLEFGSAGGRICLGPVCVTWTP